MSTAKYKKNPSIVNYVRCKWQENGKWVGYTHINYEKTEEEAREACKKSVLQAELPTFEIVYVRTVTY